MSRQLHRRSSRNNRILPDNEAQSRKATVDPIFKVSKMTQSCAAHQQTNQKQLYKSNWADAYCVYSTILYQQVVPDACSCISSCAGIIIDATRHKIHVTLYVTAIVVKKRENTQTQISFSPVSCNRAIEDRRIRYITTATQDSKRKE